jgi:hypothetical protein
MTLRSPLKLALAAASAGAALFSMTPFAQAQIVLAPHRAVYELSIDPGKTSGKIDRAQGRIAFEITGNDCQGYAITLRQVTQLDSGEGRETTSDLRSITWEGGDGKSFRFKTQNFVNQDLRDDVDGTVERNADGGFQVNLSKPKSTTFPLKGPILLPTEHLKKLIVAGAAGQTILEAKVYDGSPDGKKVYDTLSIIGAGTASAADEDPAKKPELSSVRRYPVTVSYFEQGTGERTPAYVLGFDLYENGVSRALKLDYGGFALKGELKSIEFLKAAPCKK